VIRRLAAMVAVAAALVLVGGPSAHAIIPDPQDTGVVAPTPRPMAVPGWAYGAGHATHRHHHGLQALRRATARFHSVSAAQRAGYGFFTDAKGIACIDMPAMKGMNMAGTGGMGVHFVKGALVDDPAERPTKPEAMVYRVDKDGILRLSAVEYVVVQSAWDANHSSAPKLFGHRFTLTKAGNRYGLPAFYSLHAWAWQHNPAGTFAMFNPDVTCPRTM
jgi:hypothetical protein